MSAATESRAQLQLVTAESVDTALGLMTNLSGSPVARRAALLNGVPEIISYFTDGSAALAVDFYEEERVRAGVQDRSFVTEFVVNDRTVKIRRGIAWASDPLFSDDEALASSRLAEVVQLETARPYRDTIVENRRRDPHAAGWMRITSGRGCKFCQALAAKGAIYRESTARFAAHENCHCSAAPVFAPNDFGPEAPALAYVASKRRRTPAERAAVREWISLYDE
jgi:hypothetical protein